ASVAATRSGPSRGRGCAQPGGIHQAARRYGGEQGDGNQAGQDWWRAPPREGGGMTAKKKAGRSASTEAKPRTRGKSASAPEVWDLRLYVAGHSERSAAA